MRAERIAAVHRVDDRARPHGAAAVGDLRAHGSWDFLCDTTGDPQFLRTVHAEHVFERFPADLADLAGLPLGYLAERDNPSDPWSPEPFDDG